MDAYIRAVTFLSRAAGVVAAFMIGIAVLVICDIVVERYILNLTTIWQIDVVTYCIVGATFIGSAYVLMTRGHVNVDVLPIHLKGPVRYWLAFAPMVMGFCFVIVLFVLCTAYWYQAWTNNWRSDTVWRATLWVPFLAMPIGLGLLVLQYSVEFINLMTGRAPPFGISEQAGAEEIAQEQAREALGGAG